MVSSRQCNPAAPYVLPEQLRVGEGLTRHRGEQRVNTQLVGPVGFQYGNGATCLTAESAALRQGVQGVRRGAIRPNGELKGPARYMQGQTPWTGELGTAERSRGRYEWAIQSKSLAPLGVPACPQRIEPFQLGGVSTRETKSYCEC